MDITFEINGRKVDPGKMEDVLESTILKEVQDSIKKVVGSNRCEEHGSSPKITVKGRDLDNLSIEISGCCDALIDQVKHKLKQ